MTNTTKLSKFIGNPLIKIPKEYQTIGILQGDFGKQVFDEFKGRLIDFNNKNLDVLKYENGIVTGSNSFANVLINQILSEEGLRTANQSDLEKALKYNILDLNGTYEDTALILRNKEEPNSYLAKELLKQIKKPKTPIMVPLNQLELVKDSNSNYGLSFKLREDAKIIYAPILNHETGNFSSKDINEKTGLPTKLGNGDRTLYTISSGLSRFYLNRGLVLYSRGEGLASSDSNGRVVVVSGVATENFFGEYAIELKKLEEDYVSSLMGLKDKIEIELRKHK